MLARVLYPFNGGLPCFPLMQVLPWHPLGRFLRSPVHVSGHGSAINHCMATHFPIPLVFFSCLLSWKTAWHGAGKPEGLPCFCPCLKLLSNIKNNCVPACGPLAGLLPVYPVICFHSIVPPAFSALCFLVPWFCYGCLYCLLRWATRFAIGML